MPFEIVRNDITKMHVDAVVNPTNTKMFGTAGVDGTIHKIEGPRLREETEKIGDLAPGQSVLTKAFNLPASHIIHTVGPIWKDGKSGEEDILRSCYKNSLELAKDQGFESIAFPLISSGSYGCPKDVALNIAVSSIGEFLLFNEIMVYLVVYDKKAYQLSENLFSSVEAYIDEHMLQSRHISEESDSVFYEKGISEPTRVESVEYNKPKKKSLDDVIKHLDESFS